MTQDTTKARGEAHWAAKLTEEDVRQIRELHAEGKRLRLEAARLSRSEIARKFDIDKRTVGDIVSGRAWRHVAFPGER